jgi:hypothetical protein
MTRLNLTRPAVGCADYPALAERLKFLSNAAGEIHIPTRNRPKQADQLIGGGLYFIIKHMLMGRVEIVRFDDRPDGRINIVCRLPLQRVRATPKRAHQGWRYLSAEDAPPVLCEGDMGDEFPPQLLKELSALMLI